MQSSATVMKSANILDESTGLLTGEQGKNKPQKNQPAKGEKKQEPQKGQQDKKQSPVKVQEKNQPGKKENPSKDQDRGQPKGKQADQNHQKDHGKGQNNKHNDQAGKQKNYPGGMNGKSVGKGPKYNFKHPYHFSNPGRWYPYGNKGFYTGRDFGQHRAMMARNKHREFYPRYEYEVIGAFGIIIERNVFLINQMDYKIVYLRSRLLERRNAGLITVVVYEDYMDRIVVLERERSSLQLSLNMYI